MRAAFDIYEDPLGPDSPSEKPSAGSSSLVVPGLVALSVLASSALVLYKPAGSSSWAEGFLSYFSKRESQPT
ncbi:hypothetical protein BD410DRAFT_845957 [Rickenella mellea]|uniref:Uncharacterized protein n=1 Tax=Rickenella mellea TaxID=50990 RepID=A0A4Y7PIZ9_9AGAM|nr:hypothetical protein BD410DRAFT_845957 [Rickenella mellea]